MPTSEEFRAAQARRLAFEGIESDWKRVSQLIYDNRLDDALEIAQELTGRTDALGEGYTTTHYPVCLACAGLAERDHPETRGLKVSCYINPIGTCPGNKYGRMHPAQVVDYIQGLLAARRGPTPVPEPSSEMQPNPLTEPVSVPEMQPTPAPVEREPSA